MMITVFQNLTTEFVDNSLIIPCPLLSARNCPPILSIPETLYGGLTQEQVSLPKSPSISDTVYNGLTQYL